MAPRPLTFCAPPASRLVCAPGSAGVLKWPKRHARARGQRAEILERSLAEAAELRESSEAYREAKVLDARGESARFEALQAEYALAPDVTRRRLYLETMEGVLPSIIKVIVEGDAAQVLPFVPVSSRAVSQPRAAGVPAP